MLFRDLACIEYEINVKKADLLIIIPYYNEFDILAKHLEDLGRQNYLDFNVVVVPEGSSETKRISDFLKAKKFAYGVIVAKRKGNTGSAGGYFTGQKYALENGYGYAIMADSDCRPEDKDLVRVLYENRKQGFVSPVIYTVKEDIRIRSIVPSVNHYTLVSRGVMEKYGLYYAPLYYYAEDGEYSERIKEKRRFIENYATHPLKIGEEFNKTDKTWYSLINSIHFMSFGFVWKYILFFNALVLAHAIFMNEELRRIAMVSFRLLMSFKYGKEAIDGLKTNLTYTQNVGNALRDRFEDSGYAASGIRGKAMQLIGGILENFRKEIVVESTYSYSKVIIMGIFAKKLYVGVGDRYLLLSDNGNPIIHVMKIVMFSLLLAPFTIGFGVIYLIIKALKRPKTLGYGLDQSKP